MDEPPQAGTVLAFTEMAAVISEAGQRTVEWPVTEPDGSTATHRYLLAGKRHVIALCNQKGGVGKTTSTINLAAALAVRGVSVLVLDLDPQCNTTTGLGIDPETSDLTMFEVLHADPAKRVGLAEAAVPVRPNLYVVPGSLSLATVERDGNGEGGEGLLALALRRLPATDVVLIDCPPNLGRLTVAAMAGADDLFVAVKVGPDEVEGLDRLMTTMNRVKANGLAKDDLDVRYVVTTIFDGRQLLDRDVRRMLVERFSAAYAGEVRKSTKVGEAKARELPLREYCPAEPIVEDYDQLGHTIVRRSLSESP